jgi:signal transduction histidine kinase
VLTKDKLLPCLGDQFQIRRIFTKLLKNAIAYIDPNRQGIIRVSCIQIRNKIQYCVEDNGIGLNLSKLSSLVRDKRGFGLFNIRERLEFLGGNLNIQSKPNKGTRVIMSIPLK